MSAVDAGRRTTLPADPPPICGDIAAVERLRDRMRADLLVAQQRLEGVEMALTIMRAEEPTK